MSKNRFVAFFVLLSLLTVVTECAHPDQIVEVFRHGARGPLAGYDPSWSLDQWGVLTPVGMRQQYILGKVLSQKYSKFFQSSTYNYTQIYMLTDTTPRCIQSAYAQFYGLYLGYGPSLSNSYPAQLAVPPYQDARVQNLAASLPNTEAIANNDVPNLVNIVDSLNAVIFQGHDGFYCPNVAQWIIQNTNDAASQQALAIFQDTINNVNQYLDGSKKLKAPQDIVSFGDTMLANIADNRPMPGGFTDRVLINNLTAAFSWFNFHLHNGQLIQRQLGAYNLLDAVLNQLKAFRQGQSYNPVALYSGHDSNIIAMLGALGVVSEECLMANFQSYARNHSQPVPYLNCYFPYFASNLIFEFYNETDSAYVKVFYNNAVLPLCNGQESCSYEDFLVFVNNATGNNTAESYKQKCGAKETHLIQGAVVESITTSKTVSMALMAVTALCVILFGKIIFNAKRYKQLVKESSSAPFADYLQVSDDNNAF
jgi:hypothetical protein